MVQMLLIGLVLVSLSVCAAAKPKQATMRLTVTPLGADVTLGSKWYGQISADGLIITVNAGNYKLKVTKAGYYPFSSIVSLPAGSTPLNPQPFDVVLTPVPTTTTIPRATTTTLPSDGTGTIKLTSAPSGASVYFDVSLPSPPLFGLRVSITL
jgi:hypothetical protein